MNRPGTPLPAWLRAHHLDATRPAPPPPAPGALGPARVHCWVQGPEDAPGWWPGLVVQWTRREGRWIAQVAYVVGGQAHGPQQQDPVLVLAWVDGALLRPA